MLPEFGMLKQAVTAALYSCDSERCASLTATVISEPFEVLFHIYVIHFYDR